MKQLSILAQPFYITANYFEALAADIMAASSDENRGEKAPNISPGMRIIPFKDDQEDDAVLVKYDWWEGKYSLNEVDNAIAHIKVNGALSAKRSWWGPSYEDIKEMLLASKDEPKISGVLLEINSPGGQAACIESTARIIEEVKKVKPVYAYFDMICASAAYYLASAASRIYAGENLAYVGSIGAMASFTSYKKRLEEAGIEIMTLYAPQSDLKNKYGQMLDRGEKEEFKKEYIENELAPLAQQFIDWVSKKRKITKDEALRGQLFFAKDATATGLINGVKSFDNTLAQLIRAGNKKRTNV